METLTGRLSGVPNTNNYENLTNKPMINGVELVGNVTAEELGIETGNNGGDAPVGDFVSREELQLALQNLVTTEMMSEAVAGKVDADTVNKGILIDWGDESELQGYDGTSTSSGITVDHLYQRPGRYTVRLIPQGDAKLFLYGNSAGSKLWHETSGV